MKEFIIDDDGMLMEYAGPGGDVVIPEGVNDIFFMAFRGTNKVERVVIPGTVSEVSHFIFEDKELSEAKFCEGVSLIGVCSFHACKNLETVYLPSSLKAIKSFAFAECPSLKKIYYNGTREDWRRILKDPDWCEDSYGYEMIFTKG